MTIEAVLPDSLEKEHRMARELKACYQIEPDENSVWKGACARLRADGLQKVRRCGENDA